MSMKHIFQYIEDHEAKFVAELQEFLRQPSIAAQNIGMHECAELLKSMLDEIGFTARLIPTKGHPVCFASLESKSSEKTVLVYGHYDVQPPEPLDEWKYPPFSATIEAGKIYARGATDDKGNLFTVLKSAEAFLQTTGDVPVNLKLLLEGEEEIASPNLPEFVNQHPQLLAADAALAIDGGIDPSGRPLINLGTKGICYVQLDVRAAKSDMHSMNAPLVPNAAWRLNWALNTLKDRNENILIDGFMDDVLEPTPEELELLQDIPFDPEEFKQVYGVKAILQGENKVDMLRYLLFRPTCTVAGIHSGYTGEGSKTVLPAKAMAKIDFRLVPNQKPEDIFEKVKRHLSRKDFNDVTVTKIGFLKPAKTQLNSQIVEVTRTSLLEIYGKPPIVYPIVPGSGPEYLLTDDLGLPLVLTRFGPPYPNMHAPNEYFTIEGLIKGTKAVTLIFDHFGRNSFKQ